MPRPSTKSAPTDVTVKASPKSLPFPTSESVKATKTPATKAAAGKTPVAKTAAAKVAPAVTAPKAAAKAEAKVEIKTAEAESAKSAERKNVYPFEIQNKAVRKLWLKCQPGEPKDHRGEHEKVPAPIDLAQFAPGDKPFSTGKGKQQDKDQAFKIAQELDGLQNVFYADRRFKLLVILQGMDAAGKDGTLRGVFGQMTPLGVRTVGWKAPTDIEKAHDYLWRIHQQTPGAGEIVVFNRSQYEDVLVPVVEKWITPEQQAQRFAQINDFERMLSETGTIVVKFMLNISKDEQRERLQERLDDPCKHWKFDEGDLKVRAQWDEYQHAYAQLLAATHTPWAPWTIVPADSKTHRNLMIATVLREVLSNLELKYPLGSPALDKIKVK